jgi:hypothetical protein
VTDPVKPWVNRFMEFAFGVLVAALMLSWAWALLRPLVPVMVAATLLVATIVFLSVVARFFIIRHRGW